MPTLKRFSKRGFTLVELMIVVAIIGVLAALAIYGVRKYLASAKTAEAKNSIGAITRGATAAYERETVKSELVAEGSASAAVSHALCASAANTVPAAITSVKGVKYQPNSAANADFQTGDGSTGWKCVRFEIADPIYYMYSYTKGAGTITANPANSDANGFEAAAQGDINGDGVFSQFARTGEVNTSTGTVRTATQIFINNEFE